MNGRTERGRKGDETRDGGREEGSKASEKERKEAAKREGGKTIFMNLRIIHFSTVTKNYTNITHLQIY